MSKIRLISNPTLGYILVKKGYHDYVRFTQEEMDSIMEQYFKDQYPVDANSFKSLLGVAQRRLKTSENG